MIIIGLILLIAAVAIGVAGVVNNTGTAHELQDDFTVFGVHVTGSTGTLFLAGLVVGAAGMLGLALLLAGARRTSRKARHARHELERRDAAAVPAGDAAVSPTTRAEAPRTETTQQSEHPRSLRHPFGGDTGPGTPRPSH
ncbi:hypothetical protein A5N78_00415 [Prescottella equi]|uniref:hypothetical protein n=1 Tax=Rhodococcus hoagii TaxID=43767 RepID=UPI000A0F673F|nr:hypothetical protein [Prescottella equi]ORL34720.1 hypothetical protein A6I91_00415 [Prescottella equi]ORL92705.1 hypothetical protein A5N78_00415 [Prescottella equi]ORM20860.1 hypothetical protein A5N70_07285 [Prescottella equi]